MNTDAKRYYALLGLEPTCSDEEIRSAFRRRAKALHPDVESGDATAFIRLKRAYDVLGDPAKRAQYDRANSARVRRAMRAASEAPAPPRPQSRRPGGIGFARYFVAFLFMGGLSFGAIEAMISYNEPPAPGLAQPASLLAGSSQETGKDGSRAGARTAGNGFWDPSSPDGTPRESGADDQTLMRKRPSGIGSSALE